MRDTGPSAAPMTSFLVLQGIETLSLRMERHTANALELAQWLEQRPEVSAVHYPCLASSPYRALAAECLPLGAGGVVAFELADGLEAGLRFIDGLELITHLVNLGDVRSLAIHPASTTHHQTPEEHRLAAGVTPGLIRLSVGLEGVRDLRSDLDRGLTAACPPGPASSPAQARTRTPVGR
jgi:O-acetylhomoserine (thiol)-lyase